jgi:hypothetical protein
MSTERERPEPEPTSCTPAGAGGPDPERLEQLAEQGDGFLAASDAAIRRALSGDSEAFLRATRQQGGQ